jgi:hypothetical protein
MTVADMILARTVPLATDFARESQKLLAASANQSEEKPRSLARKFAGVMFLPLSGNHFHNKITANL